MTICSAIIRKDAGGKGDRCEREATQVLKLIDDSGELVDAAPLCDFHMDKFNSGASLLIEYDPDTHVLIRSANV